MDNIIGVDVDDVVADLVSSAWLKRSNRDNDENVTEADIKSWDISQYVRCGVKIYEYLKDPSLYDEVTPVENSLWGVEKLRSMDYRIVYVTAFNANLSGRKYWWLKQYDFIDSPDDYIEARDKSLIATNFLLDDKPENVSTAFGEGIIFTREWNKSMNYFPRVDNWVDVVNYFEALRSE